MIHFTVQGPEDAPAVLLSSGLGGTASYWAPQIAALAGYRVITCDQRGTGRSPGTLPTPYSVAAMAEDVVEILDAARIGKCHFVGHALGGLIGLHLALHAPERLASLVPINAWAKLAPHTARCFAVRTEILRASGPAAYARAQPIFLHPADWLSEHAADLVAEEARGLAHFQGSANLLARIAAISAFDIAADLPNIATRTMIVATSDDMLVPWTCSKTLAAEIPTAELALFPYGGHASNVTDPAAFNAKLRSFLAIPG